MTGLWHDLPVLAQDLAILVALLAPAASIGALLLRGFAPWPILGALLGRFRWANAAFVALIAVSVAMGLALVAQERGLREGAARAAEKFDLIVAAPGSELTAMLNAVYLEPAVLPLLSGETMVELDRNPRVAMAAPLAFGDSHRGAPLVGTTEAFVRHLAPDYDGPGFTGPLQGIAGAFAPAAPGDRFAPAHGLGSEAQTGVHEEEYEIVGRLPPTGSPWDRAILVPVEGVWSTHGLADGHAPENAGQLGPPWDARYTPGTPAMIVVPMSPAAAYALQQSFTRELETMAFFPGAVLNRLYAVLGDVRQAMSLMAGVSQGLVAVAVLMGLVILMRLFQRQLAVLRALGAPGRFVAALVWTYAAVLLVAGVLAGVVLAIGGVAIVSSVLAARLDLAIPVTLGMAEVTRAAAFLGAALILALVPALAAARGPVAERLRG
ncbi:MAG: ABC transporter permease [Shimia sp.]